MCKELGVQLNELFGVSLPMTHRQFLLWCEWLDEQWNVPNRTDHYLMLLAQLQCKGLSLEDFKLKFEEAKERTVQTASQNSKMAWLARVGPAEER